MDISRFPDGFKQFAKENPEIIEFIEGQIEACVEACVDACPKRHTRDYYIERMKRRMTDDFVLPRDRESAIRIKMDDMRAIVSLCLDEKPPEDSKEDSKPSELVRKNSVLDKWMRSQTSSMKKFPDKGWKKGFRKRQDLLMNPGFKNLLYDFMRKGKWAMYRLDLFYERVTEMVEEHIEKNNVKLKKVPKEVMADFVKEAIRLHS